jgi:hypothetical protein
MQKCLQGVVNRVESEGPHSREEGREPPPQTNVVQLGDWIGAREELVPFGRRPPFAALEPQPSAEDFWGGRADALEPPAEFSQPTPAPGEAGTRVARRRLNFRFLPRIGGPGHWLVAVAVGLAVATGASIALALGGFGSGAPSRGGADGGKVPMALVLSDGLTRIFRLDLPVIEPRSVSAHRAHARRVDAARRTTAHQRPTFEPVHYSPPPRTTTTPPMQVAAYTAPATPPSQSSGTTTNTETNTETSSQPASSPPPSSSQPNSTASSAPVGATGEGGALGPIQSPNG